MFKHTPFRRRARYGTEHATNFLSIAQSQPSSGPLLIAALWHRGYPDQSA
jgi:hypothetical protein